MKNKVEINDYHEYEVVITLDRTPGQIIENVAIVEVRLYAREEKAGGDTTTRSLINTYKKEVKRPNIVQFMLGMSWQDRIESTKTNLKAQAIVRAAELWHSEILPKEIKELIEEMVEVEQIN